MLRKDLMWYCPEPLTDQDWLNLERSLVRTVMVPWHVCINPDYEGQLRRLARVRRTDKRGQAHPLDLVIRMFPGALDESSGILQQRYYRIADIIHQEGGVLLAIQGDNEPNRGLNWTWNVDPADPNGWGNRRPKPNVPSIVERHLADMDRFMEAFDGVPGGPQLVSPGWWQGPFREFDPATPGRITWRELTHPTCYNEMDGIGVHIYVDDWEWPHSHQLFGAMLREWVGLAHKLVWVTEFNINSGDKVHRIGACLGAAEIIMDHPGLNSRVAKFGPFVFNGLGNDYPPEMVMNTPACADQVRAFMLKDQEFYNAEG